MKKTLSVIFAVLLVLSLFGCSAPEKDTETLDIVCTIFPIYDWTKNICGSVAAPTMLLHNGVDLHSFQPDVDDIVTISNCDVFIYVGGESDAWVHDALKNAANKDRIVVNLLDILGDSAVTEETVEGMQEDHEHEHEHEDGEEEEYDEHIWLSLKNAEKLCKAIAEKIAEADPENGDIYRENADIYVQQLEELDAICQTASENAKNKTLVFADRFPFRYLTEDLGLEYYAAFSGCSAETEASFETIASLSEKVDEYGLKYILITETSDGKIAQTVIENTENKDAEILVLDSMQSKTIKAIAQGETYISITYKNLETLRKALAAE